MKDPIRLMRQAVAQGVFPGAVLFVQAGGLVLLHEAFGEADVFARQPMSLDTVFDLASLTKPLATAPAVLKLVQDGRMRLDDNLGDILPVLHGTDKHWITPGQLLLHTSGLPAHREFFLALAVLPPSRRRDALLRLLAEEPLEYESGTKQVYSDLGYMILKYLVEMLSGKRLDAFLQDTLYGPLGIDNLFFIDLEHGGESPAIPPAGSFAATENCSRRSCLIKAVVHDDNAFEAGGIAGQAGLFGTTRAVARFLNMLLDIYHGKITTDVLSRETVGLMLAVRPGLSRTYGFDTPDKEKSSSGRMFSTASVGHLGFTGVSLWLDVNRDILVLLFTNRIHPDRNNFKIKEFRPLIHDSIMTAITGRGYNPVKPAGRQKKQ